MTSTRRRLAVVSSSTLAVLATAALPALPAWASTSVHAGCTVADADHDATDPGEVTLTYARGDDAALSVVPSDELIAGFLTTSSTAGAHDDCGVDGGFDDVVTVRPGTSGKAAGETVTVTATLRFTGSVSATGTGDPHDAIADVDASFSVVGPGTDAEGAADVRAWSSVELHVQDSFYGSANRPYKLSATHASSTEQAVDVYDTGEGVGTVSYDVADRTVSFPAVVGEQLRVDMDLDLFTTAAGETTATADVDAFEVDLRGLDGIVLDRGDGAGEEPPPPAVTPLDLLQQARDALASYGLGKGIANSLDVKLRAAVDELLAGGDACDELGAFRAHLSAQTGKHVTSAQAAELTALVQQAQEQLGC